MTASHPTRPTYVEAKIRANTLADGDVIRTTVRGTWQQVLDVWTDDDLDLALAHYQFDAEATEKIRSHLTGLAMYVLVRLLRERPDDAMIGDELVVFTACDLVVVQVPGPLEAPHRQFRANGDNETGNDR